jgi:multidrug resistance efflux pump
MKKQLLTLFLLATLSLHAERIYATFDIQAYQSANLAFSAGGIIQEVQTDISMLVKKGDTLARLNSDDLNAKLKIAKIAMAHAEADYERQLLAKK